MQLTPGSIRYVYSPYLCLRATRGSYAQGSRCQSHPPRDTQSKGLRARATVVVWFMILERERDRQTEKDTQKELMK